MVLYRYTSVDRTGRRVRGRMDAANELDLEQRLKRMGLDLVTARGEVRRSSGFSRSVSRRDLIHFCFHLEQLTASGIPLIEGLADAADSLENPRLREVVAALREDMAGGRMLSEAMAAHPRVFDPLFVSLIRVGETSGNLGEVLANLGATLKWQDELLAQSKRLLVYPAMVLAVVGVVIVFFLLYLVPELTGFLRTVELELPAQTRLLIAASEFLGRHGPTLVAATALAVFAVRVAVRRSDAARYLWDFGKLNLPVIGPILHQIVMARFANFFALLYRSGITVLDAIAACEGVVANRYIADGLGRAAQRIAAGGGLAESFHDTGFFPPLVVRMLRIGETTGGLDQALRNATYFYNRDVREGVERALKLLEPLLTVILGLLLAGLLYAVLSPVYDLLTRIRL